MMNNEELQIELSDSAFLKLQEIIDASDKDSKPSEHLVNLMKEKSRRADARKLLEEDK